MEAETLSPLIERVVSRVSEIRQLLATVQPQLQRATSDIDDLRSRQEEQSRSLRESEAGVSNRLRSLEEALEVREAPDSTVLHSRIDEVNRRIDAIDSSAGSAGSEHLARLAETEQRLDALETHEDVQPSSAGQIEQIDQRLQALEQSNGSEQALIERVALLEQRLNSLEPDGDAEQAVFNRLAELEQRLSAYSSEIERQTSLGEVNAQTAGLNQTPTPMRETELWTRIDDLEAQVAALRSGSEAPEKQQPAALQPVANADQRALEVLREESIGVAMASVNELYRRVDQLDRQEEALSRIINLIVERNKLLPDSDIAEGGVGQ
jgi:hypothetical protein